MSEEQNFKAFCKQQAGYFSLSKQRRGKEVKKKPTNITNDDEAFGRIPRAHRAGGFSSQPRNFYDQLQS